MTQQGGETNRYFYLLLSLSRWPVTRQVYCTRVSRPTLNHYDTKRQVSGPSTRVTTTVTAPWFSHLGRWWVGVFDGERMERGVVKSNADTAGSEHKRDLKNTWRHQDCSHTHTCARTHTQRTDGCKQALHPTILQVRHPAAPLSTRDYNSPLI